MTSGRCCEDDDEVDEAERAAASQNDGAVRGAAAPQTRRRGERCLGLAGVLASSHGTQWESSAGRI